MKILYISVIEQNAGWGAEYFVNRGFIKNGYETIVLDYRKYRSQLGEKLLQIDDFDALLLQRGDWFPIELLQAVNRPKLFWASELVTRNRDQDRLLTSKQFKHIFVHSNECKNVLVNKLKWLNNDNVSVLINGFDETVQYPIPITKKDIDVLFIGNVTPRRRAILNKLNEKCKITEIMSFGNDMTKLFNRAKIILNIHSEEFLDTETRVFEALGCGAFLISEKLSSENPFTSGRHYVEVNTGDIDAIEKEIEHYLVNAKEREYIAEAGYNEALKHHTYTERAKYIVKVMKNYTAQIDRNKPAINKEAIINYINNKDKPKIYDKVYDIRMNYSLYKLSILVNSMDKEENLQGNMNQIINLINEREITHEDLVNMIVNRSIKKEELLNYIAVKFYDIKLIDIAIKLLLAAYEINNQNADTLYNLQYIVNKYGKVS